MRTRTRLCFLVVLVFVAASQAPPAQAQEQRVHRDTKQHYEIRVPESFVFRTAGDLLGSYQGSQPTTMSISRISYPSLPAWRKKQKDEFIDQVISGARQSVKGYRQNSKKSHRVGGVPTLDFHFSRGLKGSQELVWMRFLFFRRYALVASASTSSTTKSVHKKRAKEFTLSLSPARPGS